jgi:hypothetical protein
LIGWSLTSGTKTSQDFGRSNVRVPSSRIRPKLAAVLEPGIELHPASSSETIKAIPATIPYGTAMKRLGGSHGVLAHQPEN